MKKKDYLLAALAGFFTGIFIFPILKNLALKIPGALPIFLIGIPLFWMLGIFIARFLGRRFLIIYQFAKFLVVGFLNAAIDFGILNIISFYTGLTKGFIIAGVNVPGFIVAATNSYFWNKFWTFARERKPGEPVDYSDFFKFLIVVVASVFINGAIVVGVSTYVSPLFGLSPARWLNVAKVLATAVTLFWNFTGLKLFVFKK